MRPLVEPLSHDFHCFVSIWVHEDQLARLDLFHQHRGRLDDGLDAALLVPPSSTGEDTGLGRAPTRGTGLGHHIIWGQCAVLRYLMAWALLALVCACW